MHPWQQTLAKWQLIDQQHLAQERFVVLPSLQLPNFEWFNAKHVQHDYYHFFSGHHG